MNQRKSFNIPNLLSFLRLAMIPLILWLYCVKGCYGWALAVLVLSGITDIADGMIARRFQMVTDLGKALDPVADKLTQLATLGCLLTRFPYMWMPLSLLVVKELLTGIMSLYAVKKTGEVKGADWHGKLCTVLLYVVIGMHMVWIMIPGWISKALILLCMTAMCFSAVLYAYRNYKQIKGFA